MFRGLPLLLCPRTDEMVMVQPNKGTRMIGADICRPSYLSGIKTPAVVLPVGPYDETFVVFGEAGQEIACFMSGQHRFDVMPAVNNENWQGLAVEGLTVELDISSATDTTHSSPPNGSMVRSADRLEMLTIGRTSGFARASRIPVLSGLPVGDTNLAVAFTRWSLVKRDGERVLFKHDFDALKPDPGA